MVYELPRKPNQIPACSSSGDGYWLQGRQGQALSSHRHFVLSMDVGEGKGTNHTVPFCHRAFYSCFSQLISSQGRRAELWCGNRQGKKVQSKQRGGCYTHLSGQTWWPHTRLRRSQKWRDSYRNSWWQCRSLRGLSAPGDTAGKSRIEEHHPSSVSTIPKLPRQAAGLLVPLGCSP